MSAFVVSKAHIDYLVHAAQQAPGRSCQGYTMKLGGLHVDTQADEVGRALWQENVASVAHRYPRSTFGGEDFPGPIGLDHESLALYSCPVFPRLPFDPVGAIKALQCYEYQSCEHPGWPTSDAKRFCEELLSWLIDALPGYDAAPWEIHDDTLITA